MDNNGSLRSKVLSGMFWSLGERLLAQGVTFLVSIVLARILLPEDYGAVSIVMIFISILDVFISSGLGTSLIQKKDTDEVDYSTVFYAGLVLAFFLYGFVFLFAPFLARFYKMPQITGYIRVLAIRIPIGAVNTVQHAYVSKHMIFKKFFFSTLGGTLVSAVAGIFMAYMGFGAWALIVQYLTNTFIDTCVLFITLPWRPKLMFSIQRCKKLVSFGWKVVVAGLIQEIYNNLRSLAIGKKYTPADLAFYDRGQQMTSLVVSNIDSSLTKVLFPTMAGTQNDVSNVKAIMKRSINVSTFLMCPLLLGLASVAEPLTILLFTEKWLPTVPYLRLLCLANIFQSIHSTNLQAMRAMGRSDLNLKVEVIKKSYSIAILIFTIVVFRSPIAVAAGFVVATFISVFVNSQPNYKLVGYGTWEQLKDISPYLLISAVMCIAVFFTGKLVPGVILKLVAQVGVGASVYILLALGFKLETAYYVLDLIREFIFRKNRK